MNIACPWILSGILLALSVMLLGCGTARHTQQSAPAVSGVLTGAPKPPSAYLSSPNDSDSGPAAPVADAARSLQSGPGAYLYSHDPRRLELEVTRACEGASRSGDKDPLRSLIADLYFSGVHPATATEALIRSNCAEPSEIVEEMVAQGGRESLEAVVSRARMLADTGERRRIESAAAAGLAREADLVAVEYGLVPEELPAYGMLYFPSVGENSKLVTVIALNRLYEEAVPGYGIYTFVLLGRGFGTLSGEDARRYGEFFRMIETYVSATDEEAGAPSAEAHAFLIPVNPERIGSPLIDQTAFDLSEVMRRHLIQSLRHEGHGSVASRLEKGAGPFLVATLEPSLLPSRSDVSMLVTDLSQVAPEHVYGVVDAFDRPIPNETRGRPESLSAIRKRLLGLPASSVDASATNADASAWVFMLGDLASGWAVRRPAMS